MKVKGNRIEVGEWFIYIQPCLNFDFADLKFTVGFKGVVKGEFDTLEEAWEKVNERV